MPQSGRQCDLDPGVGVVGSAPRKEADREASFLGGSASGCGHHPPESAAQESRAGTCDLPSDRLGLGLDRRGDLSASHDGDD